MKQNARNYTLLQRLGALCLAVLMAVTMLPTGAVAAEATDGIFGTVTKVADPDTIRRHDEVYGDNTENAGKVTVGKSVSEDPVTISYGNTSKTFTPTGDNFIVTASQTAQVMGLASESAAPVDVVFVLDTSNSMSDEVDDLVTAANNAIRTLLQANPDNRIGVVAFSGTQGNGSSDGDAANMLSPLAHYDGEAETEHLRVIEYNTDDWDWWNDYSLLTGRGSDGVAAGTRYPTSSGTNIHAGVVAGARLLTGATRTTVNGVTRIPFLVVMSDGQPSYALDSDNWYDPDLGAQTNDLANTAGVGFLPALTAAYYKTKITQHYFGANATANNRCFIYTMGLGLNALDENNKQLALMTVDPSNQTSSNNQYNTFETYWSNYQKGSSFKVETGDDDYTITAASITATKSSISTYKYNDEYFSAAQGSDLSAAFDDIVTTIQKQAMSSPTKVDPNRGADFSGYLTYTDPIGEYMEVKKVYGLLADGNYYQGKQFAQYISDWDGAPADFKEHMIKVLRERSNTTSATMTDAQIDAFLKAAAASDYQANYVSDTDFDNSIVWYGNAYTAPGEEDTHVQWMAFADNDSVEYIEQQKAAGQIPDGADYVCRSYFYTGTAGGTVTNPNNEYMHFVVRVQRSLTAPYQQTVVISTPASLLSVEEVFITEKADGGYTAAVTEAEPARVIYEVGLRSDINAFNIDEIVGKDTAVVYTNADQTLTQTYAQETDHSGALANYDAATGTYTFYTNDWNRKRDGSEHHRAQTHVTFDAAADNSFYTYTADTLIYVADGNSYKPYSGSKPSGSGYFYARTVYDWSADNAPTNGIYDATVRTMYIPITIPSGAPVTEKDGGWYVPAGTYKASSLTGGEDVIKDENLTDTALIISHPHRTEDATNSHYTVLLGNNGKLTLQAEKTKNVDVTKPAREAHDGTKQEATTIQKADGEPVMVGDILTYTVRVLNPETTVATATVVDSIPRGTEYVDGSADPAAVLTNGVLTWNNIRVPAATTETATDGTIRSKMGETTVSFKVKVTDAALSGDLDVVTIDNTATVTLNNDYSYTTNTTKNPPEGKKVVDTNGNTITEPVVVPNVLVYRIRWQNDAVDEQGEPVAATVTVTDKIPTGTTYHPEHTQPTPKSVSEDGVITWEINAAPGASGVVSFRVNVNAAALKDSDGIRYVENDAVITVNNDPRITNVPVVTLKSGDLQLSKVVDADSIQKYGEGLWVGNGARTFTLDLYEIGDDLNGSYTAKRQMVGGTNLSDATVTFTNGKASLEIMHNEIITIEDLPAGIIILVTEQETGYTATYKVNNSATTSDTEGRVNVSADATASVEVSNAYEPEAVVFNLKGVKNLDAKMPLGDTTFGFTGERQYADGETADDFAPALITGEAKILSGKSNAEITFTPITIKKAGNYTYLIKETDGNLGGMKYDETQYKLHLVVEDDGAGKLTITSKTLAKVGSTDLVGDNGAYTDTAIVFNNTYEPAETQLSLVGTKAMTGRTAADKEFSFTVKDNAGKTAATGYNTDTDKDGKYDNIVFSPITYKPSDMGGANTKTFTYTVTEDQGGAYGVTYDTTTHTVVVTVNNNGGKLEAYVSQIDSATYTKDQAYALSFANTFQPDDVPLTLHGTKILLDGENSNADISSQLKDQQFAFQIEEEGADGTWTHVTYGNNTDTDDNDVYNNIVFGTIYYDLADVGKIFRYRIHEIEPEEGPSKDLNMTYAKNEVYVKVTVSLNASNQLVATATLDDGTTAVSAADIAFTNVKYANTIAVTPAASKSTVQKDSGGNETAFTGSTNFSFDVLELIKDSTGAITTKEIPGGVGAANGNVQFNTITYGNNDLGDHYYIIRETNRGDGYIHGIKYDQTQYVMKVTIGRTDAGQLTKAVSYHKYDSTQDFYVGESVSALTFKNEYHAETYLNVTAVKTLNNGTDFDGKTFGFHMQRVTDASGSTVHATDNAVIEGVSNATSGNVTFGTLYYDESAIAQGSTSDVRYYKIAEVKPTAGYPGVTYDNTVYVIEVTLTDNDQGTMEAKITAIYKNGTKLTTGEAENVVNVTDMANIAFNNGYTTQTGTSVDIVATKELEGRDLRAGEFQFELYYVDSTGKEHLVDTANNTDQDNDGNISFHREYAASTPTGNYNYVIKEVTGKLGGVKYNTSNTVGKVTVTIGENTDNATLTSSVSYADNTDNKIVFKNKYEPLGGALTIQGKKTLENRNAIAGEFGFDVQKQVGNTWQSVASGTNTADGSIQFTAINFAPADMLNDAEDEYLQTKEGFIFKVVEVQGNAVGVEYTKDYYQLTVKVTTDTDGKLVPTVTKTEYYQWNTQTNAYEKTEWNEQKSLDFTNIYAPQNVAVKLQANKTLNGLSMAQGEYSFVVREGLNNINGEIKATGGNAAAAADVAAPIDFSQIGYSIDDLDGETDNTKEFYYTIYELPTGQGGVQFSTNHWFAKVTLTDNEQAGKLETKVEYYKEDTLNEEDKISGIPSFTNSYVPAKANVTIPVDKTLVNKTLVAEEFTFTLTGEGKTETAKNDADGSAAFQLTFEKPGTYEYIVKESVTQPAKADGTYSLDNDVKVTVNVRDDLKGKLHATVTYTDVGADSNAVQVGGVEFINFYAAPAITEDLNAKINAKKQMNALVDYSMEGFQFKVTDTTGATIKDAQGKDLIGTSDADGNITFPNFKFDRAGEYHYWISEVDTEKPGIQIDESKWEVHILVRYHDGTTTDEIKDHAGEKVESGELYIGANDIQIYKISRAVDDTAVTPVFVNTYDPKGLTLHLTAKKVLNGRELKDREFAFYLMDGSLIAAEGFNDAQGNIRFTVNYDAADIGLHNYKVVEKQGSVPGVIYDGKEYASVTVEVKDDQTKGQLVASVGGTVLADGDTIGTGVTLTNDYIAEGNVAVVKANKVLSGKPMKAEEFTFQLVNTADEKDVHKATNTADGVVTFQFAVNKAGVTTYKLSEVKGTEANMTYDEKVYEVTVTTTDDGMGKLVTKVAYDTDDGYAPTFYNTYTPNAVPVKLVGEKVLKGRDMTAGEFKFEVRDSSGALVALGTNDAKGVLTFNEIKFSTVGTYTLTISETAGTAANVTYDTTKFQVTVEVTNEDGELVAEVTYPTSGVKFVNTYEKPEEPTVKPTEKPSNPSIPDTGDHSNVSLFMILAVVSLGACVVLVVLLKKKKQA